MKKTKRRYIRFGIGSLFVITLISALPLAWLAAKKAAWEHEEYVLREISPHVRHVERTYCGPAWLHTLCFRPEFMFRVDHLDFAGYTRPGAVWRRTDLVHPLNDELLATLAPKIAEISYLRKLHLEATSITDASAATIARFGDVEFLNIQDDKLSDVTVHKLMQQMPKTKIAFFFANRHSSLQMVTEHIPTPSSQYRTNL